MTDIQVQHQRGSYTIRFASLVAMPGRTGKILAVVDQRVLAAHRQRLETLLPADSKVLSLPAGDDSKNLASLESIWNACAEHGLRRDGLLVAIGGGVIGDMVGFAAATWMRGIDYLQVPTTLLAQVDSSVGGKTAINHPAGKNLIGAFHQPVEVLVDFSFLDSLPAREFSAGMAEIIKAALLAGEAELEQLEAQAATIMAGDRDALEQAVRMAIGLKSRIVSRDEREAGQRAFLNLGHTFGHAIERELGYGQMLHGEAVGLGLLAACRCSTTITGLDASLISRVEALLAACGLPTRLPSGMESRQLLAAMSLDKKALASGLRLVLLDQPGAPLLHQEVDEISILSAWDTIQPDA